MIPHSAFRLAQNRNADRSQSFGRTTAHALETALGGDISLHETFERARSEITTWPDYHPTPLVDLSRLATEMAVQQLLYKDEGWRFGLNSFKAMGGGYAVPTAFVERLGAAYASALAAATSIFASIVWVFNFLGIGVRAAFGILRIWPGTSNSSLRAGGRKAPMATPVATNDT